MHTFTRAAFFAALLLAGCEEPKPAPKAAAKKPAKAAPAKKIIEEGV